MNTENLEELRKALGQIKTRQSFRPMWAPIGPDSVLSNLILDAQTQAVLEASAKTDLDGYSFLYTALLGHECRQPEVDDLKGMIALLVASLKRCGDIMNADKEVKEFISKAETMIKEGE